MDERVGKIWWGKQPYLQRIAQGGGYGAVEEVRWATSRYDMILWAKPSLSLTFPLGCFAGTSHY